MQPHYHFSRLERLQEQARGSRQDVHISAGREEGQEGPVREERVGHQRVGSSEHREQQEDMGVGLEEEGVKLAQNSEMKSPATLFRANPSSSVSLPVSIMFMCYHCY